MSSQDEKMFDNKPKLFEDGDDSSEESDSERFRLRPQFEGKAGSKVRLVCWKEKAFSHSVLFISLFIPGIYFHACNNSYLINIFL